MNIWDLLSINQAQAAAPPSPLMPQSNLAPDGEVENPKAKRAIDRAASVMMDNQPPAGVSTLSLRQPVKNQGYTGQFEDAFYKNINQREASNAELKKKLDALMGEKPEGFQAMNLKPLMAFGDYLTGGHSSQAYQAPTAVKDWEGKVSKLQDSIGKETNALSDDQLNYLKMKAAEESMWARERSSDRRQRETEGRQSLNNEFKLRNEWDGDPITKNSKSIAEGYSKINNSYSKDSRASDLSLIYGLMRLQDPASTVRESEAEMAQKIGGFPAQTQALYSQLTGKGRLTKDQRDAIKKEAQVLYQAQLGQQRRVDDKYRSMASGYGFNPNNVVLSDIFADDSSNPQQGQVDEGHIYMGGDPSNPSSWKAVK